MERAVRPLCLLSVFQAVKAGINLMGNMSCPLKGRDEAA